MPVSPPIRSLRPAFWVALSLAVISLLAALSSGNWLMYRLAYTLALIIGISYAWMRLSLHGLDIEIDRHTDRVQEGDQIIENLTVRNASNWPKLWIEVEDPTELPSHQARVVLSLASRQRRIRRFATRCERRGVYGIGPVVVRTSDPFGLFRAEQQFGTRDQLLVYPRPLELTTFEVPPANLPGDGRFRRRTHYVTPNTGGVREYQTGDSFNRIHWATTARLGELMVKLFELDPASDIWIVLDLQDSSQAGEGAESTEEIGVRIAASIARLFLVGQRSVGYMAFGQRFDVVEPDRGQQQLTRILESLALTRAVGEVPVSDVLYEEGRRFGRHTTLIAITASTDEEWVTSMQSLAQRGVKVAAVYLEPETFGSTRSSLLVFGAITASDMPAYYVRQGDDLIIALSQTGQDAGAERPGARGEQR